MVKPKVLYCVSSFPRRAGDVEDPWQAELVTRLAAHCDLTVLAPAYRGLRDHDWQGVRVRRFRYLPARWETLTHGGGASVKGRTPGGKLASVAYLLAGRTAMPRELQRGAYDVLHLHWPVPHALWLYGLPRRVRVVLHWYGVELPLARRLPLGLPLLRSALHRADKNIAISSATAAALAPFAPVPPDIIPFGITCGNAVAHVEDNRPTILFVGRLVERKGVHVLLQAFARRREQLVGWQLCLVGDGPQRQALEVLMHGLFLGEQVTFCGKVSTAELRARYAGASIFVLPAAADRGGESEGLGVVLLEALHNGVPVIASHTGGITDIVTDGETGLLVPPGDADALGDALVRLAGNAALRARLAAAGQQRVARQFNWESITARVLDAYRG